MALNNQQLTDARNWINTNWSQGNPYQFINGDFGSAFDDARTAAFKSGVGAELWAEMNVGYFVGFTMRGGYARGLASLSAAGIVVTIGGSIVASTVPPQVARDLAAAHPTDRKSVV